MNSSELEVVNALLILSDSPLRHHCISKKSRNEESSPSDSSSSRSVVTADNSSFEIKPDPLRLLAVAARNLQLKIQVPYQQQMKRRKTIRRSVDCRGWKRMKVPVMRVSDPDASFMSTASSVVTRVGNMRQQCEKCTSKRDNMISPSCVWRRAEAILKFLSERCASEAKIRSEFGDSPDTSKALRMLLKLEEVQRLGAGGRRDPFQYMIKRIKNDVA